MKNSRNRTIRAHFAARLQTFLFFAALLVAFSVLAVPPIPQPDLSKANKAIRQGYAELVSHVKQIESEDASHARKAEAWGKLGMYLLAHDYLPQAQDAFQQASHYLPLDARWIYLDGYVDSLVGNQAEATTKWKKTLALNPYYYPAMVRLGKAFFEAGEMEKAKVWFEKASQHEPTRAAALVGLGQVNLQMGNAEAALKQFQQALALQPAASKLHFYLAQAYGALGQQEKAGYHMQQMGAQQEVVLPDTLLHAVSSLSRSTVKINERAVAALQAREFKQAELLAKQAVASDPENVHPQLTLAYVYAESGQHDLAEKTMRAILKGKHADNPDFNYAAGVLREMAGDDAGAVTYYRKTLAISPGYGKAKIALSKALMRAGQYAMALALNEEVMKGDDENPFLPYRSGYLSLVLDQCEKAKKYFYQSVSMQPENFAFLTAYARAVAECGGTETEMAQAVNAARNMYRIKPFLPVIEVLAAMEARLGNWESASDYQAQALFEAAKQADINPLWLQRLKNNFKQIKNKDKPQLMPQPFEEDLSPPQIKSIF